MSRASLPRFAGLTRWFLPFAASFVALAACENHLPVAPIRDGDAVCEQLVDYCAAPAAVWGAPYQSCYDTGMNGDANACLNVEDACVTPCYDANQSLAPGGGEAGAAGAANGNAGASNEGGEGGTPGASVGGEGGV